MSAPHNTTQGAEENTSALWWRHRWMNAIWASDLPLQARLVAAIYAEHARDQRTAWVTNDRLGEWMNLDPRRALEWRKKLIADGYLTEVKKAGQHKATIYALTIPVEHTSRGDAAVTPGPVDDSSRGDAPVTSEPSRGDAPDARGDAPVTPGVTLPSPNQSTDQTPSSIPGRAASLRAYTAGLLGWDDDDEKLDHLQDLLDDRAPRNPRAWLKALANNGDLTDELTTRHKTKTAAEVTKKQARETTEQHHAMNRTYLESWLDDTELDQLLTYTAEALGLDPNDRTSRVYTDAANTYRTDHQNRTDLVKKAHGIGFTTAADRVQQDLLADGIVSHSPTDPRVIQVMHDALTQQEGAA